MAKSNQNSVNKSKSINANSTSIFRRKMSFQRKKLPVVQVEAGGKKHRRKSSPVKIFRQEGMKKIKECYWSAVNDILEGNRATDHTSFAMIIVPTFPNHRTI
ncbi:hypothetical protein MTR67_015899 [Solanum verrucosum]|uniref:Uncharacterized protein n=1 Tax=Solanum verrucosum TaxID=315347 RepID=A0AAF0QEV4_SOLVR|nr:hypothetical protein MTR67_015899 [Solanum verrucosum]